MTKIKKLNQEEIQKIAAGEVVERPVNVLKELAENSIDAGSTQISIFIENGGKKLIKISDNGYGMSPEDAKMCIEHHATSKITKVEDLDSISTFGFRGEALSSISSVSKLTIKTKEQDSEHGTKLEIANGQILNEQIISCNTGTTLEVHDLFYNLPVRKKFLKSTETEWRNIVQLFYAFTLDYLNISFKLYNENKLIYNCPAVNDITARLTQLYHSSFSKNILELSCDKIHNNMHLKLSGAISNPSFDRFDRKQIFLFVNNRWVKNFKLSQAVIKGYQNILQPKKFPAAFLFLQIDSSLVDVNIHPKKEEVLFLHPKIVEQFIQNSIKDRLDKHHTEKFSLTNNINKDDELKTVLNPTNTQFELNRLTKSFSNFDKYDESSKSRNQNNINLNLQEQSQDKDSKDHNLFSSILEKHFSPSSDKTKSNEIPQDLLNANDLKQESFISFPQDIQSNDLLNKTRIIEPQEKLENKIIGQLLNTYILIENNNELILVDQHAAHERIIYEQLKNNFNEVAQIQLLFPEIIRLNKQDIEILEDYLDLLEDCGIKTRIMSDQEIAITYTPVILKNTSITDLIKQIISWIHESNSLEQEQVQKVIQEKIHAQMSCKAAVKAGDILNMQSMQEIISKLYNTDNKLTCPHGRPTIWSLGKSEIEKKFKRDYKSNARNY